MRKHLKLSPDNPATAPLSRKQYLIAGLVVIYMVWALFGWSRLFEQVDGPLLVPGKLEGCAFVPGRYSICVERASQETANAFDRSRLKLELVHNGKSLTIADSPKPGKYGDWFPFEHFRRGPNGADFSEIPIGCFVVDSPGKYTLTAESAEQPTAAAMSLTVTRAPDWLSVIVSPTAPLFALLLFILLSIPIGCMFAVIRFQPSAAWLRMGWNGIIWLLSAFHLLVGSFCIPSSFTLMLIGDSRFPPEFLWFDMAVLGIAPSLAGGLLLRVQLRRFRSESDVPRVLRLLTCVLSALLAMTAVYFAVVCVADICLRLRGARAIWGAPPDILAGVFAASLALVIMGALLFRCQLPGRPVSNQ